MVISTLIIAAICGPTEQIIIRGFSSLRVYYLGLFTWRNKYRIVKVLLIMFL